MNVTQHHNHNETLNFKWVFFERFNFQALRISDILEFSETEINIKDYKLFSSKVKQSDDYYILCLKYTGKNSGTSVINLRLKSIDQLVSLQKSINQLRENHFGNNTRNNRGLIRKFHLRSMSRYLTL